MIVTAIVCLSLSACVPEKVEIMSGNTVVISGQTYRMRGFEAPRKDGACAAERAFHSMSRMKLAKLLDRSTLSITTTGKDAHGANAATLIVEGRDIGQYMRAAGFLSTGDRGWCG